MDRNEILKQVNSVFCTIFDNDTIELQENMTADDIEEWDSLTHIQLVVFIEKHFKIRFNSQEIRKWNNIGEMINSIQSQI